MSFHYTHYLRSDLISVSRQFPKTESSAGLDTWGQLCSGSCQEVNGWHGTATMNMTQHLPCTGFPQGRGAWGEMVNGNGTHQKLGGLDKSGPVGEATPQRWYWRGVWATSGGFQCRKLPHFSVAACYLPAFTIWSLLSTIRIRNNNLLLSLAHCLWYTSMKSTPFVPWDF